MADPIIPPDDSPFATMSPHAALASLNRAILKIEQGAQRYTIGDRELWRADLRWMYPERTRLENIINNQRRGGPRFRQVVPI